MNHLVTPIYKNIGTTFKTSNTGESGNPTINSGGHKEEYNAGEEEMKNTKTVMDGLAKTVVEQKGKDFAIKAGLLNEDGSYLSPRQAFRQAQKMRVQQVDGIVSLDGEKREGYRVSVDGKIFEVAKTEEGRSDDLSARFFEFVDNALGETGSNFMMGVGATLIGVGLGKQVYSVGKGTYNLAKNFGKNQESLRPETNPKTAGMTNIKTKVKTTPTQNQELNSMTDTSSNNINDSIPHTEEQIKKNEEKSKDDIKNRINQASVKNAEDFKNGKINQKEYAKKQAAVRSIANSLAANGEVKHTELFRAGINNSDIPKKDENIDFEGHEQNITKAEELKTQIEEAKTNFDDKDKPLNSSEIKKNDAIKTAALKENELISKTLADNSKAVANNDALIKDINNAEAFK